jgi:outer membrane protein OmpA-like peptidoglycan-associated protein
MDHAPSTMTVPVPAAPAAAQRPKAGSGIPDPDFSLKHLAIAVAVLVVMVGIFAYGFYVQQTRTGAKQTGINQEIREVAPSEAVASVIPATAVISEPASIIPAAVVKQDATQADAGPFHADVYFDFGKSRLRADATATLQRQAERLKQEGHWAVLIQGYTDQHGPAEYNRSLALRRGDAVKQFLVELGVPMTSVKVVSLGKEASLCDDPTPACRRLNRRVHLEIVKLESPALPLAVTPAGDAADPTPTVNDSTVTDGQTPIDPN